MCFVDLKLRILGWGTEPIRTECQRHLQIERDHECPPCKSTYQTDSGTNGTEGQDKILYRLGWEREDFNEDFLALSWRYRFLIIVQVDFKLLSVPT